MRNPKRFKISYKKGHDLFPTSQREEEEAERHRNMRERERERAWINWRAEERVQKKVREGVGANWGARRGTKNKKQRVSINWGAEEVQKQKAGSLVNWGACKFVIEKSERREEKRRFVWSREMMRRRRSLELVGWLATSVDLQPRSLVGIVRGTKKKATKRRKEEHVTRLTYLQLNDQWLQQNSRYYCHLPPPNLPLSLYLPVYT